MSRKNSPSDENIYKDEEIYHPPFNNEAYSFDSDSLTETALANDSHHLESLLYDENIDSTQSGYHSLTFHPRIQKKPMSSFLPNDADIFPTHFLLEKLDDLGENIKEVKSQLQTRQQNRETFERQIDSDISNLEFLLKELNDHWGLGNSPSIELRRMHLERELNLLRNQKRITIDTAWKDLVWLKKYLRELVKEYQSLGRVRDLFE